MYTWVALVAYHHIILLVCRPTSKSLLTLKHQKAYFTQTNHLIKKSTIVFNFDTLLPTITSIGNVHLHEPYL